MYVTDALKLIAENTSKFGGGNYLKTRFIDVLDPPKEETRTPEEVTALMMKKLRGQ